MRVGVEVGGTFTDLIVVDGGSIAVAKVPSTPANPEVGALHAIDAADIDLTRVTDLVHGSTVATNAVLERKGARVGFLVTRGMRDVLALQRHDRASIYDLNYRKPVPLVPRRHICEIDERIGADGAVVSALESVRIESTIRKFMASASFDAIAICLLNSYINADHERALAAILRDIAPELPVTCSVDVSGEFREYERASTTVLAAYVQPTIERYLENFVSTIEQRGFCKRFSIMQSNGGRMPARAMARNAVSALYSGPAAGVVGATGIARACGYSNLITLDMGGTSTDVSLIVNGKPALAPQTRIDGLPIRTPVIDIATVGAGGGSIAWVDDGGLLRVGPESAGATPGPASYGRGGTLPTVTDAHLVRGTLQAGSFLGGAMKVDVEAAHQAFSELSRTLAMQVDGVADAVIRIAESNIVRAIQQVSTQRGHDPRDFVLVPFGGAGALHAARVADELGIRTVLVPENAGVLSAAGLLAADYIYYLSQSERLALTPASIQRVKLVLDALRDRATTYLATQGISDGLGFEPVLDMRYTGQAFEISVPLHSGADGDSGGLDLDGIFDAFTAAHHRVFEFSKPPEKAVEIVTVRMGVRAKTTNVPDLPVAGEVSSSGADVRNISITDNGERIACTVTNRSRIGREFEAGTLLIEDKTATVFVPRGWRVARIHGNHLTLTR